MFRFTIRDVLWFTVVVAFAVLWGMEIRQRRLDNPDFDLPSENARLREELASTKRALKLYKDRLDAWRD